MLGPSESADPLYHGIEIPDVPMRGIALHLAVPDSLQSLHSPASRGNCSPSSAIRARTSSRSV